MIPVILSGGSGTRLWPLSRSKLPKQFCDIFKESLHSLSLKRLIPLNSPWIITSQNLRDLTLREAKSLDIPPSHLLFEPVGRNTAPAIALLCWHFNKMGLEDQVAGIFPADHLIEKEDVFYEALQLAEREASIGKIVTLGIQPHYPATGFGYIQVGDKALNISGNIKSFPVKGFHEKPDIESAARFIKAQNYFWNAGIFVFKVKTMIEAFLKHQPQIWQMLEQLKDDLSNLKEIYGHIESISIDYAVMEKLSAETLACVPCDIGWSDVGSWDAISELMTSAEDNTVSLRSENNFVFSDQNKKYAFIDQTDLILIDTKDALLISRKGSSQSVKDVYDEVKTRWPALASEHVYEYRPWGRYEILKNTEIFKSKMIEVSPKEQISYQSHAQREEHWIITQGQGEVILNEESIPVGPGSYVKIPVGAKHRIRNTGDEKIVFIEVQLGSYFGEDDIIRYQDDYQRG